MCVPKTDILGSCLTGSMDELMGGLVDEWPTSRLDERKDIYIYIYIYIYSWVVSFEVPEDACIRIIFVLLDAVCPDSQTTMFCRNLLLRKKAAGSYETSISMYLDGVTLQQIVI